MADEGLVQYIKERLGEGYKEPQIRQLLLQSGRSEKAIDDAFGEIRRFHGRTLLPLLLLLLLVIGIVLYLSLRPDQERPIATTAPDPKPVKPTSGTILLAEQLYAETANKSKDEIYYATVSAAAGKTNAADGILLCSVNKELAYKNYCLQKLAEERREPAYCEVIGDAKQRDDCYLSIILKGEDQYCAKLVLEESERVCALLRGEA